MKKLLFVLLMLALVSTMLIGCSSNQEKSEEELREEIRADIRAELEAEAQKETDNQIDTNNDRIEVSSFAGGMDFQLVIEEDKSKEVVKGVPVYYLSKKYTNGEKKLLAQSIDRAEDWTNSIAKIVDPTMSNDGKKVYYSTDNTFSRTSGIGANNYRTRVVDLNTLEDSYFEEGALATILDNSHGPYADHVVLELNSLDSTGQPTMVYQVVTPNGDQLVVLDTPGNWQAAIDAKLGGSHSSSPKENPELAETNIGGRFNLQGFTNESINGTQVNYDDYAGVIVPMYNGVNKSKLAPHSWNIGPGTDTELTFAVFGKFENIVISYQEHMDSSPVTLEVGTVENAMVTIKTMLPWDMSHIGVTGIVMGGEGHQNSIRFVLDDMRDLSEYEPIMVKW